MSNKKIQARCICCDLQVTSTEGLMGCPRCGCKHLPVDPQKDHTVVINLQELRCLAMWSERFCMAVKDEHEQGEMMRTLRGITNRLKSQIPAHSPLLLSDDLEQVEEVYGKVQSNIIRTPENENFNPPCPKCGGKNNQCVYEPSLALADTATWSYTCDTCKHEWQETK